jgi:hypothetical protein
MEGRTSRHMGWEARGIEFARKNKNDAPGRNRHVIHTRDSTEMRIGRERATCPAASTLL